MWQIMLDFKLWYGMPSIQGAIDCTHIRVSKSTAYPGDQQYFKTSAYLIVAQVVVDMKKLFTSTHVGLPGLVNDQRMLHRSGLWKEVVHRKFMNSDSGYQNRIPLYLFGDKGYPLLNQIIIPFKDDGQSRSLAKTYFNKCHCQGNSIVKNAFGLLKENCHEMGKKIDLHIRNSYLTSYGQNVQFWTFSTLLF